MAKIAKVFYYIFKRLDLKQPQLHGLTIDEINDRQSLRGLYHVSRPLRGWVLPPDQ